MTSYIWNFNFKLKTINLSKYYKYKYCELDFT